MKFEAFQRSQGEVQQNVKPRSPRSTFDHVDPVGRSPSQVGPVGWLTGPLPSYLAPLCSQLGQVLRGNISPYGGKKESEAMRSVRPARPGRPWWPAGPSATPPRAQLSPHDRLWDPINTPLLVPCKHTPHNRLWDPINTPYLCLVNTHHT
jgi:hypothetical protein